MRLTLPLLLCLAGCDNIFKMDMTTGGPADMTVGDFAEPPNSLDIPWQIYDCNNWMGMQCGFQKTCGEAGATMITFTVTNQTTKAAKMTTVGCPSADNQGRAFI